MRSAMLVLPTSNVENAVLVLGVRLEKMGHLICSRRKTKGLVINLSLIQICVPTLIAGS